jgi:hypothetical protein
VTGLLSGGGASARAGLCGLLLLRKERRRMKGLGIVSNCERGDINEEDIPNGG